MQHNSQPPINNDNIVIVCESKLPIPGPDSGQDRRAWVETNLSYAYPGLFSAEGNNNLTDQLLRRLGGSEEAALEQLVTYLVGRNQGDSTATTALNNLIWEMQRDAIIATLEYELQERGFDTSNLTLEQWDALVVANQVLFFDGDTVWDVIGGVPYIETIKQEHEYQFIERAYGIETTEPVHEYEAICQVLMLLVALPLAETAALFWYVRKRFDDLHRRLPEPSPPPTRDQLEERHKQIEKRLHAERVPQEREELEQDRLCCEKEILHYGEYERHEQAGFQSSEPLLPEITAERARRQNLDNLPALADTSFVLPPNWPTNVRYLIWKFLGQYILVRCPDVQVEEIQMDLLEPVYPATKPDPLPQPTSTKYDDLFSKYSTPNDTAPPKPRWEISQNKLLIPCLVAYGLALLLYATGAVYESPVARVYVIVMLSIMMLAIIGVVIRKGLIAVFVVILFSASGIFKFGRHLLPRNRTWLQSGERKHADETESRRTNARRRKVSS